MLLGWSFLMPFPVHGACEFKFSFLEDIHHRLGSWAAPLSLYMPLYISFIFIIFTFNHIVFFKARKCISCVLVFPSFPGYKFSYSTPVLCDRNFCKERNVLYLHSQTLWQLATWTFDSGIKQLAPKMWQSKLSN